MLDATNAAHSLITLASPTQTEQKEDAGLTTPPRNLIPQQPPPPGLLQSTTSGPDELK